MRVWRGKTERLVIVEQEEGNERKDGQPNTDKQNCAAIDGTALLGTARWYWRETQIKGCAPTHRSASGVHTLLSQSMQSAAISGLCSRVDSMQSPSTESRIKLG